MKMIYEKEIDGMHISLQIDGYQPPMKGDYGRYCCEYKYSLRFGDVLNYQIKHEALFLSEEIDELVELLTNLLDGDIEKPYQWHMVEPDFVFQLFPEEPVKAFGYQNGSRELITIMKDIHVEWQVHLYYDGITTNGMSCNFITINMLRDDIIRFRDFLNTVRGSKKGSPNG